MSCTTLQAPSCVDPNPAFQVSEDQIKAAFLKGDGDNDDGLSLSEASEALERLSGKSVDESTIEAAADSLGVSTKGHEMDVDEFTSVVKKLEEEGKL
ncbi:hypothetical protein BDZ45DRAFT_802279 [Acephala macrosclerotiorum]|nr:hypothetical protein BDZ45DRAFT_802279 [Acephala macrosclerotiorum]